MLDEDSVTDPVKDAYANREWMNDQLDRDLTGMVAEDSAQWLVDAVVTAVTTDDLLFLIKQVERHVPGWTRP